VLAARELPTTNLRCRVPGIHCLCSSPVIADLGTRQHTIWPVSRVREDLLVPVMAVLKRLHQSARRRTKTPAFETIRLPSQDCGLFKFPLVLQGVDTFILAGRKGNRVGVGQAFSCFPARLLS